jgi:hypothetical protein
MKVIPSISVLSSKESKTKPWPTRQQRKRNFKHWLVLLSIGLILMLVITELVLRKVYGFTDAVLFRSDDNFEYIAIPQRRYRFRKHIFYNNYSQRSAPLTPLDSVILLGFGDSVINGGTQTDQDSLATSRLSDYLSHKYKQRLVVANISAGSWGPDNCYAYLKKYGNFKAKKLLLIVSSHDAYDDMNYEKVVGVLPNYPDVQYQWGIYEAVSRYLLPRFKAQFFSGEKNKNIQAAKNESFQSDSLLVNKYHPGLGFNHGFSEFKHYADSTNSSLLIYLHAEKEELLANNYNRQGKEIIDFCLKNKIQLIRELDYNFTEQDYRDDNFHLSEQGQRHMFDILKKYY